MANTIRHCGTNMSSKWDRRFLEMAKLVGSWSKDPSTCVGAVIVRPDKTIATLGYNGFARGMHDHQGLYENRDEKYSRIIHAEMNALLHAREQFHGYTLYTTLMPCDRCTVIMIQSGIKRFVTQYPAPEQLTRWADAFARTRTYIREANIELVELV